MSPLDSVRGRVIPLLSPDSPADDVDTDRIIPARFLRCVTFEGLGEHAFEDDRAQDPHHPFSDPRYADAKILVAGRNFGCGSSREHAPQSLARWGVAAVVAESFAEIFFGNCVNLGVPCVTAARADLESLAAAVVADPAAEVTVDLDAKTLTGAGVSFPVALPASARDAFLTGRYDALAELSGAADAVREAGARVPYLNGFASGL